MTEVPEHLLRRSQERRAALGLGGGDAPAGDAPAAATPATTGGAEPAGSAAPAVAAAAPSAPAPVVEAEPEVPSEVYIKLDAVKRNRVPMWVMPVLIALPFYGFLYAGAFGQRGHDEAPTGVELGRQIFASAGCSGCHGGAGEGGVGPKLAGDEVELTFPEPADQVAFVKSGSTKGQPYGSPDRPDGQRVAKGGMPSFGGTLSDAEIEAVVLYEREELK